LRTLKNWILLQAARNADRIVVASRAAAAEVSQTYQVSEDRLRVIPLGIDTEWPTAPPEERVSATLRRYGLRAGYFLFVGTLQPRKNLALLVTAFERLDEQRRDERQLVIAGRFGWGVEALREALQRKRDHRKVVWVEHVDDSALRDLYAGAGCFVYPSGAEGFGLPVIEALGAGVPVMASDLEVLREVAGSMATYLPAHDLAAWTDALASTPLTIHPDAAAARIAWARQFNWPDCARNTADVYREPL
jgi:alpha-1,3-rhamnosyl/mannosyltransferase